MARRPGPASFATPWLVHLGLLALIGLPVGGAGLALVNNALSSKGDPFAAFGSLIIGVVMIGAVVLYAVISTVAVGGYTVVRGVKAGLSTPPPPPPPAPDAPAPVARPKIAGAGSTALSVGAWHVVVIVLIVLGIPLLRRTLHAHAARLQEAANEKQVGALNKCFELTSWHLEWNPGQNQAELTVQGHAPLEGQIGLAASAMASASAPTVHADADSDVELHLGVLHYPAQPEPADFAFQIECGGGDIYYSTQATRYETITNLGRARLVRPLFPEP